MKLHPIAIALAAAVSVLAVACGGEHTPDESAPERSVDGTHLEAMIEAHVVEARLRVSARLTFIQESAGQPAITFPAVPDELALDGEAVREWTPERVVGHGGYRPRLGAPLAPGTHLITASYDLHTDCATFDGASVALELDDGGKMGPADVLPSTAGWDPMSAVLTIAVVGPAVGHSVAANADLISEPPMRFVAMYDTPVELRSIRVVLRPGEESPAAWPSESDRAATDAAADSPRAMWWTPSNRIPTKGFAFAAALSKGVVLNDPWSCDARSEPGRDGNPICVEGATCCPDGFWQCNDADGHPACDGFAWKAGRP